MNLYIVVEGEQTETKVYPAWLQILVPQLRRTRQTLWRAVQMLTQKLSCQTIHDCPKVVPLHYESEWQ